MAITITNAQTTYSGNTGWYNSSQTNGKTLKCGLNANSNLVWVTKITFTIDKTLPVGAQISFSGNVLSGTSETARMYIISQTSDTITGAQAAQMTDDNLPTGVESYAFATNSSTTPYASYNYNSAVHTEMAPGTYYAIIRRNVKYSGYHEMENIEDSITTNSSDSANGSTLYVKVNGHWEIGKTLAKANGSWT